MEHRPAGAVAARAQVRAASEASPPPVRNAELIEAIRARGIQEWMEVTGIGAQGRVGPLRRFGAPLRNTPVVEPVVSETQSAAGATSGASAAVPANEFWVMDFGAVGDGVADDTAAIQAAVDAAAAAGGGTIISNCGKYRIGDPNGSFYSGIQVTSSNLVFESEVPLCAEWLPAQQTGGVILAICPAFDNSTSYGADADCANPAFQDLENVTVRGIYFHDDDPANHCGGYSNGSCANEESHALLMSRVNNGLIQGNYFRAFGDESISMKSQGGVVAENVCLDTPGISRSAGSCISINGTDMTVRNNLIWGMRDDPLGDCPLCNANGAGIRVETNSGSDTGNIRIEGNQMFGIEGEQGIYVNSSQARVFDISIVGNSILMELEPGATCGALFNGCAFEGDSNCVPDLTCSIAFAGSAGTPVAREGVEIRDNVLRGGVQVVGSGGVGEVTVSGNRISGLGGGGRGVQASGSPLRIAQNTIEAFSQEGIYVTGIDLEPDGTSTVSISGNSLAGNNADSQPDDAIAMFSDSAGACGDDGELPGSMLIENNSVHGSGTLGSMRNGIAMAGCVRSVISSNIVDFNGSGASNGSGIVNGAIIRGNQVLDSPRYGIEWSVDGAVVAENSIERSADHALFGQGADDSSVIGNVVIDSGGFAANITGERPICMGNASRNSLSTEDKLFFCGEATSGVTWGCGTDTPAGGFCYFNQICNSSSPGC